MRSSACVRLKNAFKINLIKFTSILEEYKILDSNQKRYNNIF